MGVEYRKFLLPRPNSFRPSPATAHALVSSLQKGGWLLDPDNTALTRLPFQQMRSYRPAMSSGYFARAVGSRESFAAPLPELFDKYVDRDLMVVWPVESLGTSGLRYPLEPLPFDDPNEAEDCYYEFQLHFGRNYLYQVSEVIQPFDPEPRCPGGHAIEHRPESDEDPFYSTRLAAHCPQCGVAFDPTQLVATGRDGWSGAEFQIQGGATYRFAIVIDCGKCFAKQELRFHPELKSLIERMLNIETYEVADYY